jgi:hypothetical protein
MKDAPMVESKWEAEQKKKKLAMKKRLTALGTDNPVVKQALKSQEPMNSDAKWQEWQVVEELVNACRKKFMESDEVKLSDCLPDLTEALEGLCEK